MIKKLKSIALLCVTTAILSISLCSCMTTVTSVGAYQETPGNEYNYAKGKQVWLFWGLVPLGRTNVSTPADGNCEIETKYKLGDVLISALTGGIVSTYSIQVRSKR